MNIKLLVATHKKYNIPQDSCYLPIHVGKEGKDSIGYVGDNTGEHISNKNPFYCELTALYWGWKNLECDYIGLVHYRRYFGNRSKSNERYDRILNSNELKKILREYDVVLPKKRNYYIETLYSHYAHTFEAEHLDKTRQIISNLYPEYLIAFDKVMNQRSGHMFNMYIMKKELSDQYCIWLFNILGELEKEINVTKYDAFNARLFGRVSELLLNVWIEYNQINYIECPHIHMEKINWLKKGTAFLSAKFFNKRYSKSF